MLPSTINKTNNYYAGCISPRSKRFEVRVRNYITDRPVEYSVIISSSTNVELFLLFHLGNIFEIMRISYSIVKSL